MSSSKKLNESAAIAWDGKTKPSLKPEDTLQFSSTGEVIQPVLSDKVFKHMYTWEEMRNRTKEPAWLYDQCLEMINKNEKIAEIEKVVIKLEESIKKLAEFYRRRFDVKLGYIRTRLNELKNVEQ